MGYAAGGAALGGVVAGPAGAMVGGIIGETFQSTGRVGLCSAGRNTVPSRVYDALFCPKT